MNLTIDSCDYQFFNYHSFFLPLCLFKEIILINCKVTKVFEISSKNFYLYFIEFEILPTDGYSSTTRKTLDPKISEQLTLKANALKRQYSVTLAKLLTARLTGESASGWQRLSRWCVPPRVVPPPGQCPQGWAEAIKPVSQVPTMTGSGHHGGQGDTLHISALSLGDWPDWAHRWMGALQDPDAGDHLPELPGKPFLFSHPPFSHRSANTSSEFTSKQNRKAKLGQREQNLRKKRTAFF